MITWQWIYTYQTLIVGGIGIVGVIATLICNARIARHQRRDEIEHECATLRTALIEELKFNRLTFQKAIDDLTKNQPSARQTLIVPITENLDHFYRSSITRIGLLSQKEVGSIMAAYLTMETYDPTLSLLWPVYSKTSRHVEIPAKDYQKLLALQESLIPPLNSAIDVLERAHEPTGGPA
jgi:hypothetical protein